MLPAHLLLQWSHSTCQITPLPVPEAALPVNNEQACFMVLLLKPLFHSYPMMPRPCKWEPAYLLIFADSNRRGGGEVQGGREVCFHFCGFDSAWEEELPLPREDGVATVGAVMGSAAQGAAAPLRAGNPHTGLQENNYNLSLLTLLCSPSPPRVSSIIPFSAPSLISTPI